VKRVVLIAAAVAIGVWLFRRANSMTLANDKFAAWADAIQQHEGWFPGSRSFRNNNPGNLKFSGQFGAVGADANGFAIFPDYDTGREALIADLRAKALKYPNWSILQIMTRYLGGNPNAPAVTSEGDPFAYARAVANKLGADISDTLRQIFMSDGGQNA